MNPDAKALSADLQILSARITNALAQARLLRAELSDISDDMERITTAIQTLGVRP